MTDNQLIKFVTIKIGQQEFGIPVEHVIDILSPQKIYPIPLTRKEIIGSLNLRGKIVTALDIRLLLDIKDPILNKQGKCLILEHANELFGFDVDKVGEINSFSSDLLIHTPNNLSPFWQEVSLGIYPLENELIVILDVSKLIGSIVAT